MSSTPTYRARRERETIIRDGKTVPISFVTASRDLGFLRYILNLAAKEGHIESVPTIVFPEEDGRERTRVFTPEEYAAILAPMKRPAQRYFIALRETGARLNEPRRLTWDQVDLKAGLLRFKADQVKEKFARRTPITWELRQVLLELKEEQRRVSNLGGYVFTRSNGQVIKSVRTAFEVALAKAVEKKDIKDGDIVPHDLRRTAITTWTELGIPRDIVMRCSGHKASGVHDKYLQFTDKQLTDAFRELMVPPEERSRFKMALKRENDMMRLDAAEGISY